MPGKKFRDVRRLVRKVEDLELLLLARDRERAIENGEDRLIPLEQVMEDLGMVPRVDPPAPGGLAATKMKYRGYTGSVEYEPDDNLFHGRVDGLTDIISYQSETVEEIEAAFRESIDVYLQFCAEDGVEAQRPCTGEFALRIPPELHLEAAIAARGTRENLNDWLTGAIKMRLAARQERRAGRRRKSVGQPA
jgi:predicted HicB family RNase H-like nuclease